MDRIPKSIRRLFWIPREIIWFGIVTYCRVEYILERITNYLYIWRLFRGLAINSKKFIIYFTPKYQYYWKIVDCYIYDNKILYNIILLRMRAWITSQFHMKYYISLFQAISFVIDKFKLITYRVLNMRTLMYIWCRVDSVASSAPGGCISIVGHCRLTVGFCRSMSVCFNKSDVVGHCRLSAVF